MTTENDCIRALRKAADQLDCSPTKAEYEALGLTPASATIIRVMGGWNDAKEAAGLDTNPSTGSRVAPPPEHVPDEIRGQWTDLSVDQRWHYRHVSENAERTLRRRAGLRHWVTESKAARGCAQCGLSEAVCLDFHHQNPANKTMKISKMVTDGFSKSRLREEMEKCVVLCANCHREEHAGDTGDRSSIDRNGRSQYVTDSSEQPSSRHRQQEWVHAYKHTRGCTRCGYSNAVALDLHHADTSAKSRSVSQLVSDGCTFDQLRREVEKCDVLCANCHRKEHLKITDERPD